MLMTAKTSIYHGGYMWLAGETKDIHHHYANELEQAGFVEQAKNGETAGAKAPVVLPSFAQEFATPAEIKIETKPLRAKIERK